MSEKAGKLACPKCERAGARKVEPRFRGDSAPFVCPECGVRFGDYPKGGAPGTSSWLDYPELPEKQPHTAIIFDHDSHEVHIIRRDENDAPGLVKVETHDWMGNVSRTWMHWDADVRQDCVNRPIRKGSPGRAVRYTYLVRL